MMILTTKCIMATLQVAIALLLLSTTFTINNELPFANAWSNKLLIRDDKLTTHSSSSNDHKSSISVSTRDTNSQRTTTTTTALTSISRRHFVAITTATTSLPWLFNGDSAMAAANCYDDCFKNCQQVAPKNTEYCRDNCVEYCLQDDRRDGLSGSISAEGGEVGILGGTFGTGTVVKGKDKPPSVSIPGLDFSSSNGRKLLGY